MSGKDWREWEWEGRAGPTVRWEMPVALTGPVVLMEGSGVVFIVSGKLIRFWSTIIRGLKITSANWEHLVTLKIQNNWIYYVELQQMEPRLWSGSSGGGGKVSSPLGSACQNGDIYSRAGYWMVMNFLSPECLKEWVISIRGLQRLFLSMLLTQNTKMPWEVRNGNLIL